MDKNEEGRMVGLGILIILVTLGATCAATNHLDDLGRFINYLLTLGGSGK